MDDDTKLFIVLAVFMFFWGILIGSLFGFGKISFKSWNKLSSGRYKVYWIKPALQHSHYYLLCRKMEYDESRSSEFISDVSFSLRIFCLRECPDDMSKVKAGDTFSVRRRKKKKIPAGNDFEL